MNKFFLLALPAGIITTLILTKKSAKASEADTPSPSESEMIFDMETEDIIPAVPVMAPAVVVDAAGEASSSGGRVGQGAVNVTMPASLPGVTPYEPDEGEREESPGEVVKNELGAYQGPAMGTQFPVPGVNIITPEVELPDIDLSGMLGVEIPLPPISTKLDYSPPADSAALLVALLEEERFPGWKRVSPHVKTWQASRGLKQDGKFGAITATTLAEECGFTALVRWWPQGTTEYTLPERLGAYKAGLNAIASAKPAFDKMLSVAAARENGQGFLASPPAQLGVPQWTP